MISTAGLRERRELPGCQIKERRKCDRARISAVKALAITSHDVGRVVEMGAGGFSAEYFNSALTVGKVVEVAILETRDRFYLKNIQARFSWVTEIKGLPPGAMKVQIAGVQFLDLSDSQDALIRYLLDWHRAEADNPFKGSS